MRRYDACEIWAMSSRMNCPQNGEPELLRLRADS